MKKILFYSFVATSLLPVAFIATTAHAQDIANAATIVTASGATIPDLSSCTPTAADFASLQAIQTNPDLTSAQELSQELALRRELLAETITCASNEAQALQATLASASSTTAAEQSIQSQLSGNIDDAINFYGIEAAKVSGAGVSATETIAKEMLAWRTANYIPLEGNVDNFMLWSENQALFQTAQTRLTQTGQVVAFIENASTQNSSLDAGLQAAQSSFNEAQSENAAAGTAIAQMQPASQSLALIQQSLQSLADTYQKFSDLNTLIQTLLPTNQ